MNNLSNKNSFHIVQQGYDLLANKYANIRENFCNWDEINEFTSKLSQGAKVLDVGCGTGIPICRYLVDLGYNVVGIDTSKLMIENARKNVPEANFIEMNMTDLKFADEFFDGIISSYSLFHTPREKHADIFESFNTILKPKGIILISIACTVWEEYADYMGVEMFWSHYDSDKTKDLINAAGFDIVFGRDNNSNDEMHHWVLANKIN